MTDDPWHDVRVSYARRKGDSRIPPSHTYLHVSRCMPASLRPTGAERNLKLPTREVFLSISLAVKLYCMIFSNKMVPLKDVQVIESFQCVLHCRKKCSKHTRLRQVSRFRQKSKLQHTCDGPWKCTLRLRNRRESTVLVLICPVRMAFVFAWSINFIRNLWENFFHFPMCELTIRPRVGLYDFNLSLDTVAIPSTGCFSNFQFTSIYCGQRMLLTLTLRLIVKSSPVWLWDKRLFIWMK